jgi:DNA-binding protein HU-beta
MTTRAFKLTKKEIIMNKAELIDVISQENQVTKVKAGEFVDTLIATVQKTLKKGEDLTLVGFGTFTTSKRAARKGRNPQTGEVLNIKATTVPKFRPGKDLRETVSGSKPKAKVAAPVAKATKAVAKAPAKTAAKAAPKAAPKTATKAKKK